MSQGHPGDRDTGCTAEMNTDQGDGSVPADVLPRLLTSPRVEPAQRAEDAVRIVFDADLAEAVPTGLLALVDRLFTPGPGDHPVATPPASGSDGQHDLVGFKGRGDIVDPE